MQEKLAINGTGIEQAIRQLRHLPSDTQALVIELIEKLARTTIVPFQMDSKPPLDNIPLWLSKLRVERKSERTIKLYEYLARRFLKGNQTPTRADLREYLARRINETSPSSAETERKTLASPFSFLRSEGLWPDNLLEGIRHIGQRWGESERKCPTVVVLSTVRSLKSLA